MKPQFTLNTVPTITSVQDMVLRSARVHGNKLAIEDLKETPIARQTYGSLLNTILKFGSALRGLGIPNEVTLPSSGKTACSGV